MKNEFKTVEDLEEESIQLLRAVFKALRLDHSDYRTELLFNKNTKAIIQSYLLDVYKQGWDDRSIIL